MFMKFNFLIALMTVFVGISQAAEIAGKVVDAETGHALPGANIVLKGTSLGTASDIDGHYFITNEDHG